jgi:flavin reductase (DIM6/NTAB) family NADH-FMN oxidoreductase RutF
MPVVIIGTNVNRKATFMTLAWCSMVEYKPPLFCISSSKTHYTNIGIKENQTFSVNLPSEDMVKITDYVGIVSGKNVDKSDLFDIFYGDLETAPMIKDAPVNFECRVEKIIDLGKKTDIIIGEIVQAYAEEKYITNGIPDIKKIHPLIYSKDNNYWRIGEHIGKAFSIGHNYKKE